MLPVSRQSRSTSSAPLSLPPGEHLGNPHPGNILLQFSDHPSYPSLFCQHANSIFHLTKAIIPTVDQSMRNAATTAPCGRLPPPQSPFCRRIHAAGGVSLPVPDSASAACSWDALGRGTEDKRRWVPPPPYDAASRSLLYDCLLLFSSPGIPRGCLSRPSGPVLTL